MVKRFSDLDKALRYCRTGTGANAVSAPPTGSPLEQYQRYKNGSLRPTYTRQAASNPGRLIDAVINPFGTTLNQTSLVTVPFSERAQSNAPGNGLINACGHEGTVPDPRPQTPNGFIPAKVTIFVPSSSTGTGTSQITGLQYRKRNGASYTYPYGQKTGADRENAVRSDILTALGGASFAGTVTFNSEEF